MARDSPTPKWGSGHASAMFRQGLSELRGVFYPESNVAQPLQYSLYGTRTPGEVSEARKLGARDFDEERGRLDEPPRGEPERDGPEKE